MSSKSLIIGKLNKMSNDNLITDSQEETRDIIIVLNGDEKKDREHSMYICCLPYGTTYSIDISKSMIEDTVDLEKIKRKRCAILIKKKASNTILPVRIVKIFSIQDKDEYVKLVFAVTGDEQEDVNITIKTLVDASKTLQNVNYSIV